MLNILDEIDIRYTIWNWYQIHQIDVCIHDTLNEIDAVHQYIFNIEYTNT